MIDFKIEELTPQFLLADRNGYAIAKAIEAALQYFLARVKTGAAIIDDISTMPEWRLDEMAWELNATWYDYNADVEIKRTVISGAEEFYNRLGTASAVQRIINDVYGEGTVQEWFDYDTPGRPYHYSVSTTNNSAIFENRAKFLHLLEQVANVRSVLDNVYYYGSAPAKAYMATRAVNEIRTEKVKAKAEGKN